MNPRNGLSREALPDNIPGMKTKQPGAPTSIFAVSIASGKTKFPANPTSVDEYLTATPEPARTMLLNMRAAIRSVLPAEATEVISYKIPAFKLKKIVVWFAAFQDHCSLFPTAAIIDQFKSELSAYKTSKGTVQFPLEKPLPIALIKKLVKARLQRVG